MALKDWKKNKLSQWNSKNTAKYEKRDNKGNYLNIEIYPHYLKIRGIIVTVYKNNKPQIVNEFKTKSQALKVVKEYMRKH